MNGGRACHAFEASRCDAINFAANWPLPFPPAFPSRPSYTLSLFSTACDINSWSLEREGLEQTRGSRANNALQVARSPSATFRQLFRGSRISVQGVATRSRVSTLTPPSCSSALIFTINPRPAPQIFLRYHVWTKSMQSKNWNDYSVHRIFVSSIFHIEVN